MEVTFADVMERVRQAVPEVRQAVSDVLESSGNGSPARRNLE